MRQLWIWVKRHRWTLGTSLLLALCLAAAVWWNTLLIEAVL